MLEMLAYGITGVLLGVFTGLIPGIHPNTVIFTSIPFYLSSSIDFMLYAALISGLSVSHTFHDFIPAFYLQAPEGGTALSINIGGEMASNGQGFEAFHSTVLGGLYSLFTFTAFLPLVYLFLDEFYSLASSFMAPLLGFFLLFLIFRSGKKEALIVAVLSGSLGVIALNSSISGSFILMPVFSGLFAMPAVLSSLASGSRLPEQEEVEGFKGSRGGVVGFFAGLMAGVFPGLGAAGSTSFLTPLIESRKDFLAGMGGVNTSDIVVSLVSLMLIEKARSGTAVALNSIGTGAEYQIFSLVGVSLFCGGVSALTAVRTHKLFLRFFRSARFEYIGWAVVLLLVWASFMFSGLFGVLVLAVGSLIGSYSFLVGCRNVCMAVLLVPVILFFL
jgi:putative membrane protein